MRKNSPQNQKGAEKPTSPRLTLRFQSIKSKDDKLSSKANDVSSSQPKYQAYCVTMETRDGSFEQQKKDDPQTVSSTQNAPVTGTVTRDEVVSSSSSAPALQSKDTEEPRETPTNSVMSAPHVEKADSTEAHKEPNSSASASPSVKGNGTISKSAASATPSAADAYDFVSEEEKEEKSRKRRKSTDSAVGGPPNKAQALGSTTPQRPQHPTVTSVALFRGNEAPDPKATSTSTPTVAPTTSQPTTQATSPPKSKKKSNSDNENTVASDSELIEKKNEPASSTSVPAIVVATPVTVASSQAATSQGGSPNSGNGSSPHSPKVPPLKIVIGGLANNDISSENRERNKVTSSKTSLPYVVSAADDAGSSPNVNPDSSGASLSTTGQTHDESKDQEAGSSSSSSSTPSKLKEEERSQRVTRSSQRMQAALANAGGANLPNDPSSSTGFSSRNNAEHSGESSTDEQQQNANNSSNAAGGSTGDVLHPRKRKLRTRDGGEMSSQAQSAPNMQNLQREASNILPSSSSSSSMSSSTGEESVPQPQQLQLQQQQQLNCYQMFYNIRKQVDKRRKGMFVVHPKPPQGFKDYLLNRCSYVLEGNAASRISVPTLPPPQTLTPLMKELYQQQEKERYKLRLQHLIEREKLVLSAEQEILRVHGRAARAMANQTVPLSACSILKDEEIYNVMELEQEDKDKNVRSRYNGRLFLSWLQDVDDKWEKIKEVTLLRHHNEAESLHAVQKLDWEWKLKELAMCEVKATPVIDDIYVPMVHVSDDFELLPT